MHKDYLLKERSDMVAINNDKVDNILLQHQQNRVAIEPFIKHVKKFEETTKAIEKVKKDA